MSPMSMQHQPQNNCFHGMDVPEAVSEVGSDLENGLTAEAIATRYETDGWNELPVKSGSPAWFRFLLQFHQPLLYILLSAGSEMLLGSVSNYVVHHAPCSVMVIHGRI